VEPAKVNKEEKKPEANKACHEACCHAAEKELEKEAETVYENGTENEAEMAPKGCEDVAGEVKHMPMADNDATEEPGATIAEMIRLELEHVLRVNGVCPGFAYKVRALIEESLRDGFDKELDDERAFKFLNTLDVGRLPAVAATIAPEARRMDMELGDLLEEYGSMDICVNKSHEDLLRKILDKFRNVVETVVWSRKAAGVQQLVWLAGTALKKYKETSAPWHEIHPSVTCDGCGKHPIIGPRFKCEVCADFDFCGACHKAHAAAHGHSFRQVGAPGAEHGNPMQVQVAGFLNGKIDSVANEACAKFGRCAVFDLTGNSPSFPFSPAFRGASGAVVHPHITCDGCEQSPIIGERFKCRDMDDFDLCGTCYAKWQSLPSFLEQVPENARFDEIDVAGRVKTNAAEREDKEEGSDSEDVAGKKRLRLMREADTLRVKRLKLEQKRDFALAQAKKFESELAACDVEMKLLETKIAEAPKAEKKEDSATKASALDVTKKKAPTPEPPDVEMNPEHLRDEAAEPSLVLLEDENGEVMVIPEELLADALSQCALNGAATEVHNESLSEKGELMPEKESVVSADSWEKVSEKSEAQDLESVPAMRTEKDAKAAEKALAEKASSIEESMNDSESANDWEKAEEQFPCNEDEVKASVLASQLSAGHGPLENFWEEPGHQSSEEFGALMEQYRIQEVYSLGTPKLGDEVDRKKIAGVGPLGK
jgi:hypothetical protein